MSASPTFLLLLGFLGTQRSFAKCIGLVVINYHASVSGRKSYRVLPLLELVCSNHDHSNEILTPRPPTSDRSQTGI